MPVMPAILHRLHWSLSSHKPLTSLSAPPTSLPSLQNTAVKPERANYFDLGMTEQFTRAFSMGVDCYYKISQKLIDEGQFGSALIFTTFNYAQGNQYGAEVTANFRKADLMLLPILASNAERENKLPPVNSFLNLTNSLGFATTRSSWTMISVTLFLPALLTPTKTPRSMPTSFMAAA